jgi:hypothetical protein
MTTLSAVNPLSIEFQPKSVILVEDTEIDGTKLHLTLARPGTAQTCDTQKRYDTTQGARVDPSETLYHLHLSDGTCVSTALCLSDGSIHQLYPELRPYVNRIDWATTTVVHYVEKNSFVIHNDAQLKRDHLAVVQEMYSKQIINATLDAKELCVDDVSRVLKEKYNLRDTDLDAILGYIRLSDDEFFGDEESEEEPSWMNSARILSKSYNPDYPGCVGKHVAKRTLYDQTDIAIAKNAAMLAFVMSDHRCPTVDRRVNASCTESVHSVPLTEHCVRSTLYDDYPRNLSNFLRTSPGRPLVPTIQNDG